MLEAQLVPLMNKYLSSFIEGIENEDLQLSLWNGYVSLRNIKVNLKFLETLSLPISFEGITLNTLEIKIPWRKLDREKISVLVDGINVVALFKESLGVKSSSESKKEQKSTMADKKKDNNANGFSFDIMDFSEIFPFGASLLNCFHISIGNISICFKSGAFPSISSFSLGMSLKNLEITSPVKGKSRSVGRLQVNLSSLSVYWNYADAKEKCYLLYNFGFSIELILNLKRIESRRLSFCECVRKATIDDRIKEQLVELTLSPGLSYEDFAQELAPIVSIDECACKQIWSLFHNPHPFVNVKISIGLIDCKITKKQYLSLMDFVAGLKEWTAVNECEDRSTEKCERLEASEDNNLTNSEKVETIETETEDQTPILENHQQPINDHSSYTFNFLTIALGLVSFLFSSYSTFICFIGCLLSIPYMLFHSFFHCLLIILILVALFGIYYMCLRLYYLKLNKVTSKYTRLNDMNIGVDFTFDGIHVEIINDEEEKQSLFTLGVEDLILHCGLNEFGIQLQMNLNDVFIEDGVASSMKNQQRFLLNTSEVNDQGCCDKRYHPFIQLSVDIQNKNSPLYSYSNKDIDVMMNISPINIILSPYFLKGIINFMFPLPTSLSESPTQDNKVTEQVNNETIATYESVSQESQPLRMGISIQWHGLHCVLDTEKDTTLLHFGLERVGVDISLLGSDISLCAKIGDMFLHDCTKGSSRYSEFLSISHTKYDNFIECSVSIKGDCISLNTLIAAPIITVRMRFIKDILLFLTNSMLTECIQTLLKNLDVGAPKAHEGEVGPIVPAAQESKELTLPVIYVVLEDVIIKLPRDSYSMDCLVIHAGELSVANQELETTSLSVNLKNLHIHSDIDGEYRTVLPGTTISVNCCLGNSMGIDVDISPLIVTVGEEQIINLLTLVVDNLSESSYLFLEIKAESATNIETSTINEVESSNISRVIVQQQAEETKSLSIRVTVTIQAIGFEYFYSNGGYSSFTTGTAILGNECSKEKSLINMLLNQLRVQLSLNDDCISVGVSMSSLSINDTRDCSSICSEYKSLLSLGDWNAPALGVILKISKTSLQDFYSSAPENHSLTELVNQIQVSVYLGQLSLVPTSFIFSFLDLLFHFINALLSTLSTLDFATIIPVIDFSCFNMNQAGVKEVQVIEVQKPQIMSAISVNAHFDRLSIYMVEDCTVNDCPVFLVCFGLNASLGISPMQDISVAAKLTDLRCCRSNNSLLIQSPDMKDAISPFNLFANISITNELSHIEANINATKLLIRLGVLDGMLIMNFIKNLIPKDFDPSRYSVSSTPSNSKETDEKKSDVGVNETKKELAVQANVSFDELVVICVNDSLEYELPVIEFDVSKLNVAFELSSVMSIKCSLTIHGNYYSTNSSIWEPYIEPSTIQVSLKQENEKMSVDLSIPKLIQVNISSALISSILSAVDEMLKCNHSRHRVNSGCYVSFANYTGERLQYCIDNDGGMNELLISSAIEYQNYLYQDTILYQNVVLLCDSHEFGWIEIHYAGPHFILYSSIPSYCSDKSKCSIMAKANTIDIKNGHYLLDGIQFAVVDRTDEFANQINLVMNATSNYVIPLSIPDVPTINTDIHVDVCDQPVPSALPTHPSLALIFLNREYTVLPKRSVSLFLNDYDPIHCEVDEEKEVYIPFGNVDTILRNSIVKGQKIIQLSSPISIQNSSNQSLFIRYMNIDDEYSTEYDEIENNGISYCPLPFISNSSIHISLKENPLVYATIEMDKLQKAQLPSSINVGTSESPFYVRLIITHKTVYDVYNKQSVDTICLRIVPLLVFKNLLPVKLDYRVVKGSLILQEGLLEEGNGTEFSLASVNPLLEKQDQSIRIRIRPEGSEIFSLFDESIIPTINKNTQSCIVYDKNNLSLRLSYNCFLTTQGVVTIELFCDYWIINKTNMDITISEKKDVKLSHRLLEKLPSSFVNPTDFQVGEDHFINPFLFSCNKTDPSNALFIKCADSLWSEKVGIGAVGTSGTVEVLPDAKSEIQQKYMFGISIISAPGMFGLTKIIVLSPSIVLMNKCDVPLEFCQVNTDDIVQLKPNDPLAYQWSSSKEPIEIHVRECEEMNWSENIKLEVGEHLLLFPSVNNEVRILRMNCTLSKEHLCVVFDFADEFNTKLYLKSMEESKSMEEVATIEEQPIDQVIKIDVNVKIKGVGVSIIDKCPKEVLYLYIQDVVAQVYIYNDQSTAVSFSITKLQIDNSVNGSKYPILLGSLDAGECYHTEDGIEKTHNVLEVSVLIRKHPSFLYLDYCGFMLLPLQLSVDSATLVSLLTMISDISIVTDSWNTTSGHEVLMNSSTLSNLMAFVCPPNESYCYCGELMLQPISIRISMVNNPSEPLSADLLPSSPIFLPFRTLINTTLSLVANLQNASLQLNSFLMERRYLSMSQLVNKLVIHYVMQVVSKLYLLLGAFNVVGNPVELVGNIYEGVSAFFFEPMESLMKKPGDFFTSVGSGTSKLLSMTAFGVLDSVSKIADTVSNGIASLSLSQSYQADRAAGKTGFIHGVKSGLTGLVDDTRKGMEEKGLVGAAAGLGTALTGMVINPLAGAASSITNTVNNVKNKIHKERTIEPVRPTRYIPLNRLLLSYDYHLSYGCSLLRRVYRESSLVLLPQERYVCHCEVDDHSRILLLTTNKLLLLSMNCKLLWSDGYDSLTIKQEGKILNIEKRVSLTNMVKELTSSLDLCKVEVESDEVALLISSFIEKVEMTPVESMSVFSLKMVEILSPDTGKLRFPPDLDELTITKVSYVSRTVMLAGEGYNEDIKRKHRMYKVEVESESEKGLALWNIYFRYTNLELLHDNLKKKLNEHELEAFQIFGQTAKLFHSKNALENSVIEYIKQLSSKKNLLVLPEVSSFLKHNAFNIHWNDTNSNNN